MPETEEHAKYSVEGEWLVIHVDGCTCDEYYGHHQPYCGTEPVGKVEELISDASSGVLLANELSAVWTSLRTAEKHQHPDVQTTMTLHRLIELIEGIARAPHVELEDQTKMELFGFETGKEPLTSFEQEEPKCEGLAPFSCGNPSCPVYGEDKR